jgi:hypothetical protein
MAERKLALPIAMGFSGGLLVTVVAMRFGASPRFASILGGAVAAAAAAGILAKQRRQ